MRGTDVAGGSGARSGVSLLMVALIALAAPRARAQGEYGAVSGRVHGARGQPLGGVLVRLEQLERAGKAQGRAVPARTDTTDASGRYAFAHVGAGSYVLTFERDSLVTRRLSATVQDRPATLDVVLTTPHEAPAAEELEPIVITAKAAPPLPVIARLPDIRGTEIFAGKKTESIQVDSLPMNTSQDVSRQLFSRTPGANITETAGSGFPSNGIAFRGLNPVQSVEMNVRQDGVNIVAELYGYPENYYKPPAEAV
jgi:hypothetical protein